MLMTVLRGDLAIRQSRALIMAFKAMKDFIVQNQSLLGQRDYLHLFMQVSDTQQELSDAILKDCTEAFLMKLRTDWL